MTHRPSRGGILPLPPAKHTPRWALISRAGGQPILRAPEVTKGPLYDLVRQGWSGQHYCSWSGMDETRALTGEQGTRPAISCKP